MAKEIVEAKTFKERMMERIRKDIGKLMTNEELQQIVEEGVKKAFFEERETRDSYGYSRGKEEAWIVKELRELLKDEIEKLVKEEFDNQKEVVMEKINEVVKEGMGIALVEAINSYFSQAMYNFKDNIQNSLGQM